MLGAGGMNPKQMAQAMKAMGIKQKEISADEVVIKTGAGEIVISSPKVIEVEMQGVKTYQVMGEVSERAGISEEDIGMVMEKSGAGKAEARAALERAGGDIAQAIMELA